jgi:hypothetical protein
MHPILPITILETWISIGLKISSAFAFDQRMEGLPLEFLSPEVSLNGFVAGVCYFHHLTSFYLVYLCPSFRHLILSLRTRVISCCFDAAFYFDLFLDHGLSMSSCFASCLLTS